MRSVLMLFVLLNIFSAQAVNEGEVQPGIVLCSITSPKTTGFELVKVGKKDRAYTGSFIVEDLKFDGKYSSRTADLELKVSQLDDDEVAVADIFSINMDLHAGKHFNAKINTTQKVIDLYCYFIAQ
jgi:hypothetical protein